MRKPIKQRASVGKFKTPERLGYKPVNTPQTQPLRAGAACAFARPGVFSLPWKATIQSLILPSYRDFPVCPHSPGMPAGAYRALHVAHRTGVNRLPNSWLGGSGSAAYPLLRCCCATALAPRLRQQQGMFQACKRYFFNS